MNVLYRLVEIVEQAGRAFCRLDACVHSTSRNENNCLPDWILYYLLADTEISTQAKCLLLT